MRSKWNELCRTQYMEVGIKGGANRDSSFSETAATKESNEGNSPDGSMERGG